MNLPQEPSRLTRVGWLGPSPLLLAWLCLQFSTPAISAPGDVEIQVVSVPSTDQLTPNERHWIAAAETAAERDSRWSHREPGGLSHYFSNTVGVFNLKRQGINAYRRIQTKPGEAADAAVLMTLSEPVEIIAGPIAYSLGVAVGFPDYVNLSLLTIGGSMAVMPPFVNPIFWGIVLVYRQEGAFHRLVKAIRITITRGTSTVLRRLGFSVLMQALFQSEKATEILARAIESSEGAIKTVSVSLKELTCAIHDDEGERLVRLEFAHTERGDLQLRAIELSSPELSASQHKQLVERLKPFGWDIRDAVLHAQRLAKAGKISQLGRQPHVEKLETTVSGTLRISVRNQWVLFRSHYHLRRRKSRDGESSPCNAGLSGLAAPGPDSAATPVAATGISSQS